MDEQRCKDSLMDHIETNVILRQQLAALETKIGWQEYEIDARKKQLTAKDAVIVDVTEKLVGCMSSVKSELANFERVIDELHRTDQQRTPAYEAVSKEQTRLRRLLNAIEEADAGQLCVDEGCPHSNIEHVCISAKDAVIVKLREALKDATIEIECTSGTDMSCDPKADCSDFYAALALPNDDSALQEDRKQAKREVLDTLLDRVIEGHEGKWPMVADTIKALRNEFGVYRYGDDGNYL